MLRQLGSLTLALFAPLTVVNPVARATSGLPSPQARPATTGSASGSVGTTPRLPRASARRVQIIAHRGASAYAPENTLAAFRAAAARGATLFELDVQQTKDGKLVVVHDTTLGRTTNVEKVFPAKKPWRVRDLTLAQIRKLDAGSWFGSTYRGQRVPTLGETLRTMDGKGLDMLLEVKSPSLYPGIGKRVAAELRAHPGWLDSDRVIVQSFDWPFIRAFHGRLPQAPTGLLGTPSTSGLRAASTYAGYINPRYGDVTAGYVASVHKRGMKIFPWTVNDSATMRRIIRTGADGIITNKPDTLRRVASG
jgi:glycerophosphoryl diester phosphodiesterase